MNIANHSSTYACPVDYSFTEDQTLSARILVGINVSFGLIAIVGNVMASMAVFSTRRLNVDSTTVEAAVEAAVNEVTLPLE